jgi:hypothetical protein
MLIQVLPQAASNTRSSRHRSYSLTMPLNFVRYISSKFVLTQKTAEVEIVVEEPTFSSMGEACAKAEEWLLKDAI